MDITYVRNQFSITNARATALVVLNDDDTFTDLKDCKIVWTETTQDLDETHPMDCNRGTVSIEFLLDYWLDGKEVN